MSTTVVNSIEDARAHLSSSDMVGIGDEIHMPREGNTFDPSNTNRHKTRHIWKVILKNGMRYAERQTEGTPELDPVPARPSDLQHRGGYKHRRKSRRTKRRHHKKRQTKRRH